MMRMIEKSSIDWMQLDQFGIKLNIFANSTKACATGALRGSE